MSIRTRLALGLFAIAVVLLLPLGLALRSLDRVHDETMALRDRDFAASLLLGRMRSATEDLRGAETSLLFIPEVASRDAMALQISRLSRMLDTLRTYQLREAAEQIRSAIAAVVRYAPLEYQAALAGRTRAADTLSNRHVVPAINSVDRAIVAAQTSLRERTRERVQATAALTEEAQRVAAGALALAIALALLIAFALWRSISRPVHDLAQGMAAVADGNFGHRLSVSPERRDEFGRLSGSFRTMAAQLAQLDRLKAEFISVASHEIKTPLNVILGYLQLLEEGVYGPISGRQREIIKTLDTQTRSLARLVHQLLDVSRFEAGGGKIYPRPMDLRRFLHELEGTFRVLSLQRGIHFEVEYGDDLPTEVHWDADRMNEVLGNLLSNAFKFTERDGHITLRVDAVDDQVQLAVSDTGAGIPPSQLPHIFEKFFQADNQGPSSLGGTGLGLAIAKQIVVAHGGSIVADSTLAVGTTFTITLPVQSGRPSTAVSREFAVGEPA
ncbi:MAG TPA: HAMP domain-containing sensor histidine kinase [Gemmatimonadaceae bacterium]|nr:HAMP domain-containing sensor histidine kinase [Gemmatimonadaceae bacterium]